MPLYTPGRRRAIVLLLLTSVLLLTLDLRGNAVFDAVRSGFTRFMEPIESAADVATKPVINAWRGITRWEEVSRENDRLRDRLAAQNADWIAARAAIQDQRELFADRDLPSLGDYPRITAMVIGQSPSNFDQVIEINKGSNDGIAVGMPVVAPGGLVGKVTTPLLPDRARVMLLTDTRYATAAKIIAGTPPTTTTVPPPPPDPSDPSAPPRSVDPSSSLPGGGEPGGSAGSAPGTEPSTSSTISPEASTGTAPGSVPATQTTPPSVPPTSAPPPDAAEPPTTTTTIDMTLERDTGLLVGRGPSSLPQVSLLDDTSDIGRLVEGDLVFTAGDDENLAPPGVPIGVVRNRINRSPAEGPLLEVEPSADLERLHFVDIIVYRSPSEAGPRPEGSEAGG